MEVLLTARTLEICIKGKEVLKGTSTNLILQSVLLKEQGKWGKGVILLLILSALGKRETKKRGGCIMISGGKKRKPGRLKKGGLNKNTFR